MGVNEVPFLEISVLVDNLNKRITKVTINMEWWETGRFWLLNLGQRYGVNPYIFGALYVGTIPFFMLSLGWTIKSIRKKRSVILPLILTGIFFKAAYIYVLLAGRNIPWWVYILILLLLIYGAITTFLKIKKKAG